MALNPIISESSEKRRPGPKAFVDTVAASRIRDLREARGLTQEGLAAAIRLMAELNGWHKGFGPVGLDAFTVRAIERDGHVPHISRQLGLALFFEVDRRDIWNVENRRPRQAA